MGKRTHQSKTAKPRGLIEDVCRILEQLSGIEEISEGRPNGYSGKPKVILPERWANQRPEIEVCDVNCGKRVIRVRARKPGAIVRLLGARLEQRGIVVA